MYSSAELAQEEVKVLQITCTTSSHGQMQLELSSIQLTNSHTSGHCSASICDMLKSFSAKHPCTTLVSSVFFCIKRPTFQGKKKGSKTELKRCLSNLNSTCHQFLSFPGACLRLSTAMLSPDIISRTLRVHDGELSVT